MRMCREGERQQTCENSRCIEQGVREIMAFRFLRTTKLLKTFAVSSLNKRNLSDDIWKLGKLNHVAIAVNNLESATKFYKDVLGATVSERQALPEHGVYTVFVELGNTKIELLHPLGDHSPISSFLQNKHDGGIHHICIEVSDIDKAVADLKSKNIRLLSPEPRIGAHGKPVMFLHPKDCDGVLVELEQE
ncbi:methylmalonyl-CoA epimerase, mitochondrial-like [Dendronephthya gigantea]|uniref:methylmalonyl-CoA epimerase, mitochondrial-like n=1 Tax=Dendronephthya gigantea TaxID=151771 RepID=UPI00106AA233|nr:methylmalonyl-CoA epimerase, mitochondrial-like [Dendronephthya gigantea]